MHKAARQTDTQQPTQSALHNQRHMMLAETANGLITYAVVTTVIQLWLDFNVISIDSGPCDVHSTN